jgi:hypothetical protein
MFTVLSFEAGPRLSFRPRAELAISGRNAAHRVTIAEERMSAATSSDVKAACALTNMSAPNDRKRNVTNWVLDYSTTKLRAVTSAGAAREWP